MWYKGLIQYGGDMYMYWFQAFEGEVIRYLTLLRGNEIVCHYNRVWQLRPIDAETEAVLELLYFNVL